MHFPLPAERRIRSLGSATLHLAYTALGRLDGVIDEKVRLWDIAAAVALLDAAGLSISYLSGNPFPARLLEREGPIIRYVAGPPAFVGAAEKWLG